ncbi:MAG: hypothetical protein ACJ741_04475 [Pyrinomonadaceae bacterium]
MNPSEIRQLTLEGFGREEKTTPIVRRRAPATTPNADLVGRSFSDGASEVTVRGVSTTNPAHVVVEREHDGHTWTIHAGVVRMIVSRTRHNKRAA